MAHLIVVSNLAVLGEDHEERCPISWLSSELVNYNYTHLLIGRPECHSAHEAYELYNTF